MSLRPKNDHFVSSIQIPKLSLQRLILAMDTDNDLKITADDIRLFSHKHFVYLNEEVYEGMVEEVVRRRPKPLPHRMEKEVAPMTCEEIRNACNNIHILYILAFTSLLPPSSLLPPPSSLLPPTTFLLPPPISLIEVNF